MSPFLVTPDELTKFVVDVLRSVGVSEEHSRITADVLVTTDTWGVQRRRQGRAGLCQTPDGRRIAGTGPAEDRQGRSGLGHRRRRFGIGHGDVVVGDETAMQKAKACGIGYVGVRNSCHFGGAGYYAHMAAAGHDRHLDGQRLSQR